MRESGILMHITSLPGPYGIGTMGKSAYQFVDFLKQAGQRYWQLLPLSPTGYGDSPYQAFSTCAGNHYLIDLDTLMQEGLLKQEELNSVCWDSNPRSGCGSCGWPGTGSSRIQLMRSSSGKTPTGWRTTACSLPSRSIWAARSGPNGRRS